MIQTQAIIRSLPLVASVLGRRYGVEVSVGGDTASTDGRRIRLPALPPDGDPTLLGLVRGYVDHESAHIRFTDFSVLADGTAITPLLKFVWNVIEDWRVEHALAEVYPGCRANFDWLIDHHFSSPPKTGRSPAMQVADYLVHAVRAWDSPGPAAVRDILAARISRTHPELLRGVDGILGEARAGCTSSADAMAYARRIVDLVAQAAQEEKDRQSENAKQVKRKGGNAGASPESQADSGKTPLEKLLEAAGTELPDDLGQQIADQLGKTSAKSVDTRVSIAGEGTKPAKPIPPADLEASHRATAALGARLDALLQARRLKRCIPGRRGRLDTHRLHLIRHDPRLFVRDGERVAVNTLVQILLDCSGSMKGRIALAANACHAIAGALSRIDGVKVGVAVFPAEDAEDGPTVCPLLKPGQRIHPDLLVKADGSTPMGQALWWALREGLPRPETRKIVFVITDGCPDSPDEAAKAVAHGKALGFEFCGVGIGSDEILKLLPETSEHIEDIGQLAPCLFRILQRTLAG